MFYKTSTAVIAAMLNLILLAVVLVCAPRPYSNNVWLEALMIITSGTGFGIACVRLCSEHDSPLPVAITGAQIAFRWLFFVALMAVPIIFAGCGIKFKYYALIHFIGFGVCVIFTIATRMSIKAIESQDDKHVAVVGNRRRCYLKFSQLIDEMKQVGFGGSELMNKMFRLNKDIRYGFGQCDMTKTEDDGIIKLIDEMRNAFCEHDEGKMASLADVLRGELDNRELIARISSHEM